MALRNWAVVTGAGSGLGRALCQRLSRDGISVVCCGRREAPLRETAKQCARTAKESALCDIVIADIGTTDGRASLLGRIFDRCNAPHQKLLYLVHNAAVGDPSVVGTIDIDHFRYALEVNVVAPLALTQALLPRLQEGAGGRVLHMGTSVAHTAQSGTATYGLSKAAFYRLYQQLALDLKDTGVLVGSASPGIVDTEGLRAHVAKASSLGLPHAEYFHELYRQGPESMQRKADVVEFLFQLLTVCPSDEFGRCEHHVRDATEWGWPGTTRASLRGRI